MKANIIFTTVPDKSTGERIGNHLVKQQLAACVNILPKMHSIYQWNGEVHSESEYLLLIKTLTVINKKVFKKIKQLHPYQVPEIVSIDILDGDIDYLKWIENYVE